MLLTMLLTERLQFQVVLLDSSGSDDAKDGSGSSNDGSSGSNGAKE